MILEQRFDILVIFCETVNKIAKEQKPLAELCPGDSLRKIRFWLELWSISKQSPENMKLVHMFKFMCGEQPRTRTVLWSDET